MILQILNDLTSQIRRYSDGSSVSFYAPNNGRKKEKNRKYTKVDINSLMTINDSSIEKYFSSKQTFASNIKTMLKERFDNSYNDGVLNAMSWFDPKNWEEDKS